MNLHFGLDSILLIAFSTLIISFLGLILNRSNIITTFLSIEMMVLSINLTFIIYSFFLDDMLGQLYAIFFLTIGAAESAIGLSLLVTFFRTRQNVSIYNFLTRN